MKSPISILLLAFLAVTINAQEKEQSKDSLVGKVESVRPGSIDVTTADKTSHTLTVNAETKAEVDGKNVTVEQVPIKSSVTVDYIQKGAEQIVKEIKST